MSRRALGGVDGAEGRHVSPLSNSVRTSALAFGQTISSRGMTNDSESGWCGGRPSRPPCHVGCVVQRGCTRRRELTGRLESESESGLKVRPPKQPQPRLEMASLESDATQITKYSLGDKDLHMIERRRDLGDNILI
jgi:hypothetical protein